MTLRRGHGAGAGQPRIEVMPPDELPAGEPGPTRAAIPADRGEQGRFARGNTLAAEAGRANAGKSRLASRLGLATLPAGAAFGRYRAAASSFRRAQCAELARSVGGGHCGPAPSSLVASAALQLAWSRYIGDLAATTEDASAAADLALRASRLADASRQSLMAAHELCAREAMARPRQNSIDALRARLTGGGQ